MSSPRTLTFFGGAATASGSMILLEAAGARVLLDAGLFEGGAGADEKNRELPLDPARVNAVLLSQAGLAYAGRVQQLVRHGFTGSIYATPATRDLAAVLHTETALGHELSGGEAVYSLADVVATQALTVGQPYHRAVHLRRNLVFEFADAGHTLGSASIELRTGEGGSHRIVYSGCLGRSGSPLLRDPEPMPGPVDTLIIGGPYAHAKHLMFGDAQHQLATLIRETAERGGRFIVPASSVGPIHEFIRAVQELWRRGMIPEVPIWLDTPAPISHSTILRLHPEAIPRGEQAYLAHGGPFDQALVRQGGAEGGRAALEAHTGPAIIIAPSEMGDTGRITHHLRQSLPEAKDTVLFISFQEEGSVGQQLLDGAEQVSIGGRNAAVKARVAALPAYSGHADGEELRTWVRSLGGDIKRAFVVHGDDLAVAMMVTILREESVRDVIVPREGESFPF